MIKQIHVDVCDSTQDLLKEQTSSGGAILVSTNKQTKGRGRGLNSWVDLPGSLCFSLSVEPHKILSLTAIEISLLVVRFFEYEGCKLGLKWPNDLWDAKGLKCGGILVQGGGQILLAGIGLNLFSDHPDFGGVYLESFLFDKKSWSLRIAEFILSHRYADSEALRKDWELRCPHLGSEVSITEGAEKSVGVFKGLGPSGEALLTTTAGERAYYNGTLRLTSSLR